MIVLPISLIALFLYHIWLPIQLLNRGGDVKKNPGNKSYTGQFLTICHWNLDRITAHNFIKTALLKAYLSIHKMDIVCLFETFLDSAIPIDNNNLQITGYSSVVIYAASWCTFQLQSKLKKLWLKKLLIFSEKKIIIFYIF